ncbi:MAG TPA: AFG1/ZapE family ATPase [Rhodothermales bacterium]|nr:AFG1/ZapE family ATPase [Rhodothermales bacterium]
MQPPDRFHDATFDSYRAQDPGQRAALEEASAFVTLIRSGKVTSKLRRLLKRSLSPKWKGLYLVGPVGTGKTHLLAAMYHALEPEISCAFMHSSDLFRITEHPDTFARTLARRYDVLCLDEVELDDPANEARLIYILKNLEKLGVTLLATSNVEPERFLSNETGNDRFRRFLNEEFRRHYKVVFVGGDDFRRRLSKPGHAWIGSSQSARAAMQAAFDSDSRGKHWLAFDAFRDASTSTEHRKLVRRLAEYDALYLADVIIGNPDDALRLLRVVDDLYRIPSPPVLYFTSEHAPDCWFRASDLRGAVNKGVAEKFERTTSRLYALCEIEFVGPESAVA